MTSIAPNFNYRHLYKCLTVIQGLFKYDLLILTIAPNFNYRHLYKCLTVIQGLFKYDLLNIDNPYFEQMVGQTYPTKLQLNKANSSDTKAPFLDLNLAITNSIVFFYLIYDKRDDFNFEIVNFPFLDGDVHRSPSYGVYISQLILFASVC